jgi:hypothetical protein
MFLLFSGLNPKGYRLLRQRRRELVNPCRGVIDGELICRYTGRILVLFTFTFKKNSSDILFLLCLLSFETNFETNFLIRSA